MKIGLVALGFVSGAFVAACSLQAQQVEARIVRSVLLTSGAICVVEAHDDVAAQELCVAAERALQDDADRIFLLTRKDGGSDGSQ